MACELHKGNSQLNSLDGSVCRFCAFLIFPLYYRHEQIYMNLIESLWFPFGSLRWNPEVDKRFHLWGKSLDFWYLLISIISIGKNRCVAWHQSPSLHHTPSLRLVQGCQDGNVNKKKSRASAAEHIPIFSWNKQGVHWTRLMRWFYLKWLASLKRPKHSQRRLGKCDLKS